MPEIPASLAPVIAFGIDIAKALVLLVVGWIVAARLARFARDRATESSRVDPTLGVFIANTVRWVLLAALLLAALQTFGFQVTSLVAILGAAALAVGLALQGTLSHLAAGLMILMFRPYKLGDFVQVGSDMGTVTDINIFLTELTGIDGAKIYMPNGSAWGSSITNHSVNPFRRCDIRFAISYDDDMDKACRLILEAVNADERFLDAPAPPWVRVVELGESSVDIELRAWARAEDVWEARFATLKAVKMAFDANGISIPFPHRTMVMKNAA